MIIRRQTGKSTPFIHLFMLSVFIYFFFYVTRLNAVFECCCFMNETERPTKLSRTMCDRTNANLFRISFAQVFFLSLLLIALCLSCSFIHIFFFLNRNIQSQLVFVSLSFILFSVHIVSRSLGSTYTHTFIDIITFDVYACL